MTSPNEKLAFIEGTFAGMLILARTGTWMPVKTITEAQQMTKELLQDLHEGRLVDPRMVEVDRHLKSREEQASRDSERLEEVG